MQRIDCRTVGILGYGVDGRCVAEWLAGQAVQEVRVFDDDGGEEKGDWEKGKREWGETLDGVDLLFRSPGFPLAHPLVLEAKEKGIPITSSTTFFLQHFPGTTIGVTGSNGKTTCSTLIARMLEAEFPGRVAEGGNDRTPRLDLLISTCSTKDTDVMPEQSSNNAAKRDRQWSSSCSSRECVTIKTRSGMTNESPDSSFRFAVLELSSFQLIDCPVSPHVAVVLNISRNHLDWHTSMEEYSEAKRQIVAHQRGGMAILNQRDPIVRTFAEGLNGEVRWFEDPPDCEIRCKTHPDTIRAAVTAARALNVSEDTIIGVLGSFSGAPHRLEFIRELDGISYYNDSSCTTPESAIVACEAFPTGSLALLLGGRDKGMDFSKLYEVIRERNVRVVPYGEMAEVFEGNIPQHHTLKTKSSFEEAIQTARNVGRPNVILSPACASFDMFANAKVRGGEFSRLVLALR